MDIWSTYMAEATNGEPVFDFPPSDKREFDPLARGYAAAPAPALAAGTAPAQITSRPRERLSGTG